MKVLRIYDHLGELKKEFSLYMVGNDFKWQASYPEPVWLGTITLQEAGTEPEEPAEQYFTEPEPELEVKVEEVKDEPKSHDRKRSRVKGSTPSASPESTKRLHQDDFGRDTNQGD